MFVRVVSFEGINIKELERTRERGEALFRPLIEKLEGYRGNLELVSETGKTLSITFFDSEENAEAAEETFSSEAPKEMGEIFKLWAGRRVSVQRYRVLADSRR